jgi:hypothetical protein
MMEPLGCAADNAEMDLRFHEIPKLNQEMYCPEEQFRSVHGLGKTIGGSESLPTGLAQAKAFASRNAADRQFKRIDQCAL